MVEYHAAFRARAALCGLVFDKESFQILAAGL